MGVLADRQPTFFVYDMNQNNVFEQVAKLKFVINDNETDFEMVSSSLVILKLSWANEIIILGLAKCNAIYFLLSFQTWVYTKIIWGDGRTTDDPYIPPDTPPCGFFNENCPEDISGM